MGPDVSLADLCILLGMDMNASNDDVRRPTLKHNCCQHCTQKAFCIQVRGWWKCIDCVEDIDRRYWKIKNMKDTSEEYWDWTNLGKEPGNG